MAEVSAVYETYGVYKTVMVRMREISGELANVRVYRINMQKCICHESRVGVVK